jgi:hypothetical protein
MKRRQVLAALGAVSGSSALLTGTGAFTSVSADRAVSVSVADDSDAFLALAPSSGPNGTFATETGGTLALDFSDTDAGGEGLGTDSVYEFDDVFRVENQGTQPVYVWSTFSGASGNFDANGAATDIWLYPNGDSQDKLRDSDDDVLYLGIGQSAEIGVYVNTTDVTSDQDLTMTIHADADSPAGSGAVGSGGTAIAGPTNGLVGYWPLDNIGDGIADDVVGMKDGTPNGGISSAPGQVGSGASFDPQSTQYIEVPSIQIDGSLTVAAWARRESNNKYHAVSTQGENTSTATRNWWLGGSKGSNRIHWSVFDEDGNNKRMDSNSGTLPLNEYTHIAGVYDENADEMRIYADGSPAGASSVSAFSIATSTRPGGIGAEIDVSGPTDRFDGRIDDVRVYNRALSDSEIQTLYDETK